MLNKLLFIYIVLHSSPEFYLGGVFICIIINPIQFLQISLNKILIYLHNELPKHLNGTSSSTFFSP